MRRERAGRKGKVVTVAGPLVLARQDASRLLAELKRESGSGGTLKRRPSGEGEAAFELEIQGDHVERVVARLSALGFRARAAGGRGA